MTGASTEQTDIGNTGEIIALIPAYAPEQSMADLIRELTAEFSHIVVVDDGCGEAYAGIFAQAAAFPQVHILKHEENKGKGRALKTGFAYILEHFPKALGVVTLDADGQHTVKDTLCCCEAFRRQPGSIVFGCRDFASDHQIPARSRFGNRLTSRLMKFFCDISLSDTQTGLRVHALSYLPELLKVEGERYEYEMNVIFYLKEIGVPFAEVPIEVIYLNNNESSHFNPIVDSFKIYKVFFKFCISSFGSAILDYLIFLLVSGGLLRFLGADAAVMLYRIEISTVIARVCSGLFNYHFNRHIFRSREGVSSSGPRYLLLWVIQMTISALLVKNLVLLAGGKEWLIKPLVDTLLFFISYKVQQLWVFRKGKEASSGR
ncbi:MAG: bifunctional glycosyltransferase family 2/GtrA family protein [Lachnospiraceae bacterium]|nr:bifunctional glycosyltransferase family 2/GtrA family protein [Lachnospiraceae bacterium]